MGFAGSDDAGVYRISDELALVLTVDYFPPIVDDPFDFGRVAAANALSDVYAMGGRPVAALNVAGFPEGTLPPDVLGDVLRGGAETVKAAGAVVVGGHTVKDAELKYGLVVVGFVRPDRIMTNAGARPGDSIILTKPLGTGVLSTALKKGDLDDGTLKILVELMTTLNEAASAKMLEFSATACTDVTGFGLAGHALEMAEASGITIEIDASAVPVMAGAADAVKKGYLTGGGKQNRDYVLKKTRLEASVDPVMQALLFDPQTSGGLLIAVPAGSARALLEHLTPACPRSAVIGSCLPHGEVSLILR